MYLLDSEHRDHACRVSRRLGVDSSDARVGVDRAHERHLDHSFELQVFDILAFPAQQAGFFDAFTMSSRLRSGFGAQCHGPEVDDI